MISRCTSSVRKEHVVVPTHLNWTARCTQNCRRCSQVCCRCSHLLSGRPIALTDSLRYSQAYLNHSHGTPVPVIRDPSYSDGLPECPPSVLYSPEIDTSKLTILILSETAVGFQWLKDIVVMNDGLQGALSNEKASSRRILHISMDWKFEIMTGSLPIGYEETPNANWLLIESCCIGQSENEPY
jgi:hypothetical protein